MQASKLKCTTPPTDYGTEVCNPADEISGTASASFVTGSGNSLRHLDLSWPPSADG